VVGGDIDAAAAIQTVTGANIVVDGGWSAVLPGPAA
jgi:hypothetical protein